MTGRRHEIFAAFLGETLERGIPYWWRPRGYSMQPVIEDGDRVLVAPVDPRRLRVGDIVKFRLGDQLRMHRLVARRRGGQLVFRGDASDTEEVVATPAVIGIAVAVERGGRIIALDSVRARLMGRYRVFQPRRYKAFPA